jgi:hypothetical protein
VSAVLQLTHTPLRPSYACGNCGELWPCPPAKAELTEQHQDDTLRLGQYLGAHMADAMEAATANPGWGRVDDLFDRFMGWMPRGTVNRNAA